MRINVDASNPHQPLTQDLHRHPWRLLHVPFHVHQHAGLDFHLRGLPRFSFQTTSSSTSTHYSHLFILALLHLNPQVHVRAPGHLHVHVHSNMYIHIYIDLTTSAPIGHFSHDFMLHAPCIMLLPLLDKQHVQLVHGLTSRVSWNGVDDENGCSTPCPGTCGSKQPSRNLQIVLHSS